MNNVDRIKAELKRIMEACHDENGNPITYGEDCAYARLYELKEYIDSMQEDPVSIWHDASEPVVGNNPKIILYDPKYNWIDVHAYSKCKNYINESKCKWAYAKDLINLSNVERTGKNWKEEPVSEELEEAAWLYYDKNRLPIPPEWDLHKEFIDFFKAGADWQKRMMMKDAIETSANATITKGLYLEVRLNPNIFHLGDKVKLIIIKED